MYKTQVCFWARLMYTSYFHTIVHMIMLNVNKTQMEFKILFCHMLPR